MTDDGHPGSLLTKLVTYPNITSMPCSFSVIDDLWPIAIKMCLQNVQGTFNFTNPGVITHDEILKIYKEIIKPDHTWNLAPNNGSRPAYFVNTDKLEALFPGQIPHIRDAVRSLIVRWKTKEKVTLQFKNVKLSQPVEFATEELTSIVRELRWTVDEKLAVVEAITGQDVEKFVKEILAAVHIECFVAGNFVEEDGRKIMDLITNTLNPTPILPSQIPQVRVIQLNIAADYLLQKVGPNPENNNSALVNYYQIGVETPRLRALTSIVVQLLLEPFFNQLRTQEQLGYVVQRNAFVVGNVYAIKLAIQSTAKDPIYLDERISLFLKNFRETIAAMPEDEFKTNVRSVITKKEEKPHILAQHAMNFWEAILVHQANFDLEKLEIKYLKESLTKEEALQFYDEFLLRANQGGKLSIQVFGNAHPQPSSNEENGITKSEVEGNNKPGRKVVKIGEYHLFKQRMYTYPLRTDAV